ncbi:MAG: periplasmic heavy metal sensor [Terracidiphilus sp.]|jgi:Spy/CpxP family protein refolding chaperone
MNYWKAVRIAVVIAGVAMAGSTLALAQEPGGGPGNGPGFGGHQPPFERAFGSQGDHGKWWHNPKLVAELKLTDAQSKAMDDTLQQHRETLIDLRASVQRAEVELEPMMKEDQPNESQILAQIDKVAQARAELEKANARFLLAIRSKLSPEQWKQLQADRASHAQSLHDWNRDGQRPTGQFHRHQAPPPAPGDGTPAGAPPPPSSDFE